MYMSSHKMILQLDVVLFRFIVVYHTMISMCVFSQSGPTVILYGLATMPVQVISGADPGFFAGVGPNGGDAAKGGCCMRAPTGGSGGPPPENF